MCSDFYSAAWKRRMAIVVRVGVGLSVMILRHVDVVRQRPNRHHWAGIEEAARRYPHDEAGLTRRGTSIAMAVAGCSIGRSGAEDACRKGRKGQDRRSTHEMSLHEAAVDATTYIANGGPLIPVSKGARKARERRQLRTR